VISLNLVLAGLRLGLKNHQVGEKWIADDCFYLWESSMKTIKLLITSILLLSSIQAYSIENLYHSSPEPRGIRVTIKGDKDD
jgi:hypothetical protein